MPLPPSSSSCAFRILTAAALVAAMLPSQQVRVQAPLGALAQPAAPAGSLDDPGTQVDMFENPNLDRYLRRAQDDLGRQNYQNAISLLQDVIEGRTTEVVTSGADEAAAADGPRSSATPAAPGTNKPARQDVNVDAHAGFRVVGNKPPNQPPQPKQPELDARNAVFSQDGRIYRPVSRLCHELLARMPTVGLEIYRASHEVAAEEMLQAALQDGSVVALEQVTSRYFVTLPAGRAMALLADRLMHDGRYRAAVLVLNDLLGVYPEENRKRLGISDVWCRFKIALCLRLAGETSTAHDAVQQLATAYPQESLRVLGELHAVKDLPTDQLFARDVASVDRSSLLAGRASCLEQAEPLVPLWQFRFRNPEPYKEPKPSNDRNNVVFFDGGVTSALMPFAGRYGPATWVTFAGQDRNGLPQALFFEHFRMRVADATNGLLAAQSDANDEPPVARDQHPRVRIAATDFATLRPVVDGERCYAVLGHKRASSASLDTLKSSELVAYHPDTLQRLWSSEQWLDGDAGLRDVTFLAAPTVFGERLLLPSLRRGKYTLECLDRRTGQPLWNAPVHGGGSPFWKAPGCPVVVQSGIAYVATNAGCVASVDAFTGDLRWIRRYERIDPLRKGSKARRPSREDPMQMGMQGQFRQDELRGFQPSDMFVHDGLVIVAPCDSDMLLCLDGATGQPQWMLDATMPTNYAVYGKMRGLVGLIGEDLFAVSDTHLVAIGAAGGLVKWARELPAWNGPKNTGRGRGTIAGSRVLVPGEREVLVFATDGALVGRVPLPAFDASREPLAGSVQLVAQGPWLAVGYQGGIEMFSSAKALRELAEHVVDARRKADLLLRADQTDLAIEVLSKALRSEPEAPRQRQLGGDLLAIARDRALAVARPGDASEALRLLDTFRDLLAEPSVRLNWHLTRVELCKERGDLAAHETEQNRLYAYMEGKG